MSGLVIMAMMMNHELCYDELKIHAKLDFTLRILLFFGLNPMVLQWQNGQFKSEHAVWF